MEISFVISFTPGDIASAIVKPMMYTGDIKTLNIGSGNEILGKDNKDFTAKTTG
jgi:hypothetical protein